MVRFIDLKKDEIETFFSGKKIVCFGRGRRLDIFLKNHPALRVSGIIDNYKENDVLVIDGRPVPVQLPKEATNLSKEDTVVVVTSIRIDEIIEQMDAMEEFEQICCFAEISLDDYVGLDDIQKHRLKQMISKLSCRTPESVLKENYGEYNLYSTVKKYQVWEYFGATNTGGSKARTDIKQIIGNMGYQRIGVHCSSGKKGTAKAAYSDGLIREEWTRFADRIEDDSIVFLQFPAPEEIRFPKEVILQMKREKKLCFACFIHDVNVLRGLAGSRTREDEFQFMMEVNDFLIVHNDAMLRYFSGIGIKKEKLIVLGIFDYLFERTLQKKKFEKSILIAGNLGAEKSRYLNQLGSLASLKVCLYGPNFSEDILGNAKNVTYCGSFPAEILPQKLDRGFGLVWDGSSIDTCAGETGEYLRYNNPHKMSLYLASGLPVIIWSGAAQAEFVKNHRIGIVVDSLYEVEGILERMSENEYQNYAENAGKLSVLLRSGAYTKTVVRRVEEMAEKKRQNGG